MEESSTKVNTANGRGKSGKRSHAEEKKRRQALINEYRAKHAKPAEPIGHPPGGLFDADIPFHGKMYRFDLGEGRSLYLVGQCRQDAYCHPCLSYEAILKEETPPVLEEREADWLTKFSVNDRSVIAGAIIVSGEKFGVLLRDKVFADGVCRVGAPSEPCVYDGIVRPDRLYLDQLGDSFGYIPVCKDGKWTVLLLAERKSDMRMFSELAGPFEHPTAEAASEWAEKNKASFALGRVVSAEPEG